MRRLLQSAWVIARRDYVAAVFSRVFLTFLIGPVLIFATVGLITFASAGGPKAPADAPQVAIALDAGDAARIEAARGRLVARMGNDFVPALTRIAPHRPDAAAALLRRDRGIAAVLSGTLDAPVLTMVDGGDVGPGPISLLVDAARTAPAAGPVAITRHVVSVPARPRAADRADLARGSQVAIFFFILLLAGMLLSNFIEEKSNKVIEVLAAAAPVDAIFLGKLAGMLAISVTAILVWGAGAGIGILVAAPNIAAGLAVPAVGWPLFCLLGVGYFAMVYLLIGAVFLGIGSQASSPREVQMMSMPVTMGQVLLLTFASAGVGDPDGWVAKAAAVFPWSSPLAMIGRAAELPALWPHLLAFAWQALWLAIAIRFASRRFRRSVLKSGGGRR